MTLTVEMISASTNIAITMPKTDADSGSEVLAEFAGRACYQSWDRPNKDTAENSGYLNNILMQEHFSVIEHGSVSLYIQGVSRSLTHELVRHRHFSYSQLSQRYVNSLDTPIVMPADPLLPTSVRILIEQHNKYTNDVYQKIMHEMNIALENEDISNLERRKRARQTARAVMANYSETKIVVTGNHRAWRHFIHKRAHPAADPEIRALAVQVYRILSAHAPNVYQDCHTVALLDGTYSVTVENSE